MTRRNKQRRLVEAAQPVVDLQILKGMIIVIGVSQVIYKLLVHLAKPSITTAYRHACIYTYG